MARCSTETAVPTPLAGATPVIGRWGSPQLLPRMYQNSITARLGSSHKLMPAVLMEADMTASLTALASSLPAQAGLLASQPGQLLIALVAVALIIIVGKFVLKLAWRLVTIGIVVVAAFFLLSTAGLI